MASIDFGLLYNATTELADIKAPWFQDLFIPALDKVLDMEPPFGITGKDACMILLTTYWKIRNARWKWHVPDYDTFRDFILPELIRRAYEKDREMVGEYGQEFTTEVKTWLQANPRWHP